MSAPTPEVFLSRVQHHWSHDGGRSPGAFYDLTCMWVRLPGTSVWVLVDQQPTPLSDPGRPTLPRGAA